LLSRYSTAKTQNKGRASSSIGSQQSGRQRKVRQIVASPRRVRRTARYHLDTNTILNTNA
ncbi:hypothetical protein Dimus_024677, partial [Dionaea muscipula]